MCILVLDLCLEKEASHLSSPYYFGKTVFESLICVLKKGGIQCIKHTYQFEKKTLLC